MNVDYTCIKDCIEWICCKVGKVTSEEEVERLCLRYILKFSGESLFCRDFVECVKNALFQEPITLAYYPERFETFDGVYFCLHGVKLSKEEVKRAREEMLKSRRLIDSSCIVNKMLKAFFGVEGEEFYPFRLYRRKSDYWVYLSLIEDVFEDAEFHIRIAEKIEGVYVIVVLTEKTPLPFIKFFRNYSETFRRHGILVWVADVEREFLNPFIGYPPEEELISRFKNPEVATKVESLWRVKVNDVDGG